MERVRVKYISFQIAAFFPSSCTDHWFISYEQHNLSVTNCVTDMEKNIIDTLKMSVKHEQ